MGRPEPFLSAPREHRACVIARHEKHGYLLLLTGTCDKRHQLPFRHFVSGEVRGADYHGVAKAAAIEGLLAQTGLDFRKTPSRLQRKFFPAQVQEKMGRTCFFEVLLGDADSLCGQDVTSSLSGELSFLLSICEEHLGFSFQRDLQIAADAVRTSDKRGSMALLATRVTYSPQTCCLAGMCNLLSGYFWSGREVPKATNAWKGAGYTFRPPFVRIV
ncbi:unnamed protein product [Effrenium voratum]|uniref:Uncharacterized protein n=1 Tax=Effrenium voratum TaxID=2562239 RepID=A0AA36NBI8_9DINO|nr:unnamed protein product [Effrenium voratum]CAJ1418526.1 unnamed protein product [Effrenium voratum]